MVNFYIPDFYNICEANLAFIDYMFANPDKFHNCRIAAVYGSFPGMIWDGGRLTSATHISQEKWQNAILSFNRRGIPVRFTCTNSMLTECHLSDEYCNNILRYADNGMNEVIINSKILENYIKSNYKSYKFISSTTKCITSISLLEEELKKGYYLVVPDFIFNNTDNLFKISHPEKCELLLNDSCGQNCKNRKLDYEQVSRLNLGLHSDMHIECPFKAYKSMSVYELIKFNPASISAEDVYDRYYETGFRHFKIVGRRNSPISCIETYIYYMVKNEYKWEVLSHFIKLLA